MSKVQKPQKRSNETNNVLYYEEISDEAFIEEILSDSNLDRITAVLFKEKMLNKLNIKKIASGLQAKFESKHKLDEYEYILPKTDKNLLIAFRDGKLTFEQFWARIWELGGGIKYVVPDDLKEKTPEWLLQAMNKNKKHVKFLYDNRDNS